MWLSGTKNHSSLDSNPHYYYLFKMVYGLMEFLITEAKLTKALDSAQVNFISRSWGPGVGKAGSLPKLKVVLKKY